MYDHLFLFRPYHLQRGVTGQTSNYFFKQENQNKMDTSNKKKTKENLVHST